MADTAFDGFTLVTSLLSTDKFLAQRSAGGINFTLATLAAAVGQLAGDGALATPGWSFASDPDTGIYRPGANTLAVVTGGTERIRIASSGSVGIGITPSTHALEVRGASEGASTIAATTASAMMALRPDGDYGSVIRIGGAGAGANILKFLIAGDVERFRIGSGGAIHAGADNAQTVGTSSIRWSTVYAATGTINTSDEREKVWIGIREDSRAVWLRIANRIFGELGLYQWRDAVEEKGEAAARMHFGARAQRVWQIVADEGLAPPLVDGLPAADWAGPPPPAFLCFDQWEAEHVEEPVYSKTLVGEDGEPLQTGTRTVVSREAGNRFGFRTDQLGMLLSWATHCENQDLKARVAALEAAAS